MTEGKIHWEDARRGRNVGRRKSVGVLLLVVGTIAPTQTPAFLQDQGRGVASGAAPVTHNRASICPTLAIGGKAKTLVGFLQCNQSSRGRCQHSTSPFFLFNLFLSLSLLYFFYLALRKNNVTSLF